MWQIQIFILYFHHITVFEALFHSAVIKETFFFYQRTPLNVAKERRHEDIARFLTDVSGM